VSGIGEVGTATAQLLSVVNPPGMTEKLSATTDSAAHSTQPSPEEAEEAEIDIKGKQAISSASAVKDPADAAKRKPLIEEALTKQLEMQQQLLEQLQTQRVLQSKLEEHGKYLQKILNNPTKDNDN